MNLLQRLRNRETLNQKQSFVYTPSMLIALANEADLVIPWCRVPVHNDRVIMIRVDQYCRKHGISRPLQFGKIRLFNICGEAAMFFKSYILIYGYCGDKTELEFNLLHKTKFAFDLMLQAGGTCPQTTATSFKQCSTKKSGQRFFSDAVNMGLNTHSFSCELLCSIQIRWNISLAGETTFIQEMEKRTLFDISVFAVFSFV